jgi:NitT/TauT family transport system substrate-binding protein
MSKQDVSKHDDERRTLPPDDRDIANGRHTQCSCVELMGNLPPDDPDIADGAPDPRMKVDYDPQDPSSGLRALVGAGAGIERRSFLKASLVAGLSSVMPQAWGQKAKDEVVRVGYIPITDAAALLIAFDQGMYKKNGLEAVRPELHRGWTPLVEAFQAHRHNLAHLLNPIPLWMRYNNRFPIKIVAWDHTNGSACVVGRHTGAQSFKDFGGMQVAVPWWYSNHNIILQVFLRDAGITPVIRPQEAKLAPNECNLLVLAPPDMPPAIAAKKIDAYIVAEPFNSLGELKAGAKVMRFTGDFWKGHPCCVVVMHEADVEDPGRAAWTQAVMDAVVEAQIWIAENRREAARRLSRDGGNYLPFPFEVIDRAMNFYDPAYYSNPPAIKHVEWQQSRINMQGWPYPSGTRFVAEELRRVVLTGDKTFLNNLETDFIVRDLVNYSFIKKSLEKNPRWRNDLSVPQTDNPYERQEIMKL